MDTLEQDLKALQEEPFPDHPDADELDDALMELLELDSYYAGLASSTIAGAPPPRTLHVLTPLRETITTLSPVGDRDRSICEGALRRLDLLERIRAALVEHSRTR